MESSIQNQPAKRKRGRPAGSKNKPKPPAPATTESKAVAKQANVDEHVRKINVLVEKVDHNEDKIEQYYRSIGQHIAAIKSEKPDDWLTIVGTQCNLKKTRAYDLLAIANGTKTVEQVRGATALRVRESRKKELPLRSGKGAPVEVAPPAEGKNSLGKPLSPNFDPDHKMRHRGTPISRLRKPHHGGLPFVKEEGNDADPEAAAEARKAEFARMDGERATATVSDLIRASYLEDADLVEVWDAASPERRHELVRQRWDMLELARKEIEAVAAVEEEKHAGKVAGAAG
jgi:hypothetical protein